MSAATTWRCPECGYEMETGEFKATPGIEFSMLWFCPVDGHALDRLDAFGMLEAEHRTGRPQSFEEFTKQDHVLGVIHAEVPDGSE